MKEMKAKSECITSKEFWTPEWLGPRVAHWKVNWIEIDWPSSLTQRSGAWFEPSVHSDTQVGVYRREVLRQHVFSKEKSFTFSWIAVSFLIPSSLVFWGFSWTYLRCKIGVFCGKQLSGRKKVSLSRFSLYPEQHCEIFIVRTLI